MNYQKIKDLAKQYGCAVTDLLVLAPQNDPFYVDTDGQKAAGETG